jgi:hypothetical protein
LKTSDSDFLWNFTAIEFVEWLEYELVWLNALSGADQKRRISIPTIKNLQDPRKSNATKQINTPETGLF